MKLDLIIKGVFALAALVAAGTYAWNTFVDRAETAHADSGAGVDTKEGTSIISFGANTNGGFVAVLRYAPDPLTDTPRQCITFYEIKRSGADGEGKLYLVGSRCIDYDAGPDLIRFEAEKGYAPSELKKAIEKGAKGERR
jgi:hypothetical protein